jgi:hypothetical protein
MYLDVNEDYTRKATSGVATPFVTTSWDPEMWLERFG